MNASSEEIFRVIAKTKLELEKKETEFNDMIVEHLPLLLKHKVAKLTVNRENLMRRGGFFEETLKRP